jgi:hypothetical protein
MAADSWAVEYAAADSRAAECTADSPEAAGFTAAAGNRSRACLSSELLWRRQYPFIGSGLAQRASITLVATESFPCSRAAAIFFEVKLPLGNGVSVLDVSRSGAAMIGARTFRHQEHFRNGAKEQG